MLWPYIYFYSCCCFHFWNTTRATSVAPPPPVCCGRGSSSQQPRHLDKEDLVASGILPPKPAANASCCSSIHAAFKHVHHACSDFECNFFYCLSFCFKQIYACCVTIFVCRLFCLASIDSFCYCQSTSISIMLAHGKILFVQANGPITDLVRWLR